MSICLYAETELSKTPEVSGAYMSFGTLDYLIPPETSECLPLRTLDSSLSTEDLGFSSDRFQLSECAGSNQFIVDGDGPFSEPQDKVNIQFRAPVEFLFSDASCGECFLRSPQMYRVAFKCSVG